ncbi:hypothetical protein MIR68_003891 [Amoeboaphelidium protococcarum]|nr:hypothetical protein MIR68_003891 [Amoeboaphelidium protococcarum]
MNGINSPRRCKSISKKPQTTLAQSFAYATSELAPEDSVSQTHLNVENIPPSSSEIINLTCPSPIKAIPKCKSKSESKSQVSSRASRSIVWQFFDKNAVNQQGKIQCKVSSCGKWFKYNPSSTTTQLQHINAVHEKMALIAETQPSLLNLQDNEDVVAMISHQIENQYSPEKFRDVLIRLIVANNLSFEFVEYPEVKEIIQLVRPTVTKDLISADTVRNEIAKRAQQRDMQVIHYIDKNWDLQSALIDFVPFTGKHSGVKISEKFRLIAQESFGGFEKVLSVTCDNASNNLTFVESLISLEDFDESGHMRCFAHVINLAVKEAYKIFEKDIKVIRDLIVSLRRSSLLMEKFEEICVKKEVTVRQPCYDVPTRWNSTWEMLTYAVEYKKVFDLLCLVATGDGFKEQYRTIKWDVLEQLCLFLRKFAKATTTLSGSKYGTLNQVLPMHVNLTNHCLKMKTSRVQVVRQAADAALQKLNQYCTTFTDYNVIATVLDPRSKARFFDQNKNLLHYDIVNVDDESPGSEIAQSIVQRYLTRLYQDRVPIAEEELSEVDDFDAELYGGEGVSSDNVDNHLTTHLRDTQMAVLAAMAKDFLAIPATSVPSESAFSTGRQIVTDQRGSLEPNTIRNVMVLRDVYRKQGNIHVYDFVESTYTVEGIESVDSTSEEE